MPDAPEKLRLDKWLWHARFFKTRSLAAKQVSGGHVRVNGERVQKSAFQISLGDVLTFAQAHRVRVIKVAAMGVRRGPANEAQTLFEDMTPPDEAPQPAPQRVGERPTKRDRRAIDALRGDN
ncbi:RNA-binding S4 domain-containing protein [Arenibacterium sp. CAU 1754]